MPASDDEQFERIPWDQLKMPPSPRGRAMYVAAAALVAAAVSATLARNLASSPALTSATFPTTTLASPAPALTTTPSSPSTTVAGPVLWTEADLMAVHPESLAAEAAAVAEWLVSDYFTVDGSGDLIDSLAGVLPAGSPLPTPAPGYRSFVEWVQAISVIESAPAEWAVTVLIRRLAAMDADPYERLPLQAVEVTMRWSDQGWSVMDVPAVTALPQLARADPWPEAELPEEVVARALAATGGEGTVIGGGAVGEGWRVVVETADPNGGRWPLVVWLDATAAPPS